MLLALLIGVAWSAIYLFGRITAPKPPAVSLAEMDPAIVSVLEECYGAVRDSPRSGEAWGKLGTALLAYEFKNQAQICFREAEQRAPDDPRWPYFHGLSMFPDSTDEGLGKLRRAVDLHGNADSAARNRLATILLEQGHFDEAEQHFRIVLKRWPDDPAAILGLGKLAFVRGRLEESLTYLNRAASNRHTAKASRHLIATVYQRLGQTEEATQVIREVAELPNDVPLPDPFIDEASNVRTGRKAWLDYATQLIRQGRLDEATPLVLRTVRVYPNSAEAWILLARIHMRRKDYAAAKDSWEMALERAPEAVEAHMQLGVTLLHTGQANAAIERFQRAIELKPNLSEAHHNLGLSFTAVGQTGDALKAFREAIRLQPGFVDSYLGMADLLGSAGDIGQARKLLDQAFQLDPSDARTIRLRQKYGAGSTP
jgi:tetratricopeptide (TPR) repeat protein